MHSLLDRSVHWGVAISGYIFSRSLKLHKTCQNGVYTKNVILFGTIFRRVASLVTEILPQNQNFRIHLCIYNIIYKSIGLLSTMAETPKIRTQ